MSFTLFEEECLRSFFYFLDSLFLFKYFYSLFWPIFRISFTFLILSNFLGYRARIEDENKRNEALTEETKTLFPDGVIDFDKECGDDPFQLGLYAKDIFEYYQRRELQFPVKKYLGSQSELNKNMRSILVDWLVEVQVKSSF